jgi:hypothetical protein
MRKSPVVPSYTNWLAASITRYEDLAKSIIRHNPEKGRGVEAAVRSALRAVLPSRFSIGTGFAITSAGDMSPQLDLVIYDALHNAPVILEGGTGLFPIECIYASVEVKSLLNAKGIHDAARSIGTVRSFVNHGKFVEYGAKDIGNGRSLVTKIEAPMSLAPRSFVFAVRASYKDPEAVIEALRAAAGPNVAHFHGVAVLHKEWLIRQIAHKESLTFKAETGSTFARFCSTVLDTVQSMKVSPASMDRYLGISTQ